MKKLISKIFGFNPPPEDEPLHASNQVARERLKLALTYDRASIGYNALEQLRDEIIEVIARHLDLDQEDITIQLDRTMEQDKLIASIPLRINARVQRSRAPATPRPMPSAAVRRRR